MFTGLVECRAPVRRVAGLVYDVETGLLDDVVRWEAPEERSSSR